MTAYERIGGGRVRSPAETSERRKRVRGFWHHCDYASGTLGETYLARRGIGWVAQCANVRFRADCPHPDGGRFPALVALVLDGQGNIAAAHRTYLAPSGRKAQLATQKASLGPIAGGAIRLHPATPCMVVGEGLETVASATMLLDLPGWSGIACGNLGDSMQLPALVQRVVIAADNDEAGLDAAQRAAWRWEGEGRTVCIVAPDIPGEDFNDLLLRALSAGGPN